MISSQAVTRIVRGNGLMIAIVPILIAVSAFLAILPEDLVLFFGVLLVGLPLAALVISKRTRNTAVIVMLVLLPLTAILKAFTGIRLAPLVFDLGLLLACILHLGEGLLRGKLRAGAPDLLLLFLWVLALLQIFNPNVPTMQAGIEGFRKFIFMSMAFYISRHLFHMPDFRLFSKGMILFSIPVTLYGIKQFLVMWPIDYRMIELSTSSPITFLMGGWVRPFSTMSGPFQLGLYLVVTLPLLLVLLTRSKPKPWLRFALIVLLALQIALLMMTRTKGNWGGFLVGLIMLVLLQSHNPIRAAFRLIGLAVVGGLVLGLVLYVASGETRAVLDDAVVAITNPFEAPTFVFRMQLWTEEMIPALREQWLLGYGTSSAGEGLQNLYEGTSSQFFYSHNLYIKILLEMGLIGFLAFLVLIGASMWGGLRYLYRATSIKPQAAMLLQWSLAVTVAFLIAGIVIPTLDAYPANYYFWLLLGVLSRARTLG
ncbi:MAG: O-antigen ligase family protein [Candidatus Promineofilum sp.]|nr:O-antigen ligase family protein [Promineifilum sp.]